MSIQYFKLPVIVFAAAIWAMGSFSSASASSEEAAVPLDEGPIYLKMRPISAPIWKNGRVRYTIFLTLSLEFEDRDKKRIAYNRIPKLRDAFLLNVHNKSILYRDEKRGIDFARLKKRLMASAAKAVGKSTVKDILVIEAHSGR